MKNYEIVIDLRPDQIDSISRIVEDRGTSFVALLNKFIDKGIDEHLKNIEIMNEEDLKTSEAAFDFIKNKKNIG